MYAKHSPKFFKRHKVIADHGRDQSWLYAVLSKTRGSALAGQQKHDQKIGNKQLKKKKKCNITP